MGDPACALVPRQPVQLLQLAQLTSIIFPLPPLPIREMQVLSCKSQESYGIYSPVLLQPLRETGNFGRVSSLVAGGAAVAKPIVFRFGDRDLSFTMTKVDRSKLYGYKETEVLAEDGQRCELATLADDGSTVVGRGGTGIGQLSAAGLWCDKQTLRPVDQDGKGIQPVPSSFSAPIRLFETASVGDYLNHNIRLVYHVTSEDVLDDLVAELKKGTLFAFPYSYRGGLAADAGFLLMGEEDKIFMLVGNPTKLEFIGLQQLAVVDEADEEDEEADEMDFDMI